MQARFGAKRISATINPNFQTYIKNKNRMSVAVFLLTYTVFLLEFV